MGLEENRKKLSAALEIQRELERKITAYNDMLEGSISSPQLNERVIGGVKKSESDRLSDLAGEIETKKTILEQKKREINRCIGRLPISELEDKILMLRYYDCLVWGKVASFMGYDESWIRKIERICLSKIDI